MSYNQQGGTSSLKNLFNYSFPGVHLLQISLVKDLSDEDSYKRKHFSFITLAPGKKVDRSESASGRTFDWQNRINMKADPDRILSLGYSLRTLAESAKYFYNEQSQQNDQAVLFALRSVQLMRKTIEGSISGWSLFADSSRSSYGGGQGSIKSFSLQLAPDQKKPERPTITLWGKEGQNKSLNYSMTPPQAIALADVCDFIGKKALELEFEYESNKSGAPRQQNNQQQQQNNQQQQQNNQQQQPNYTANQQNTDDLPPLSGETPSTNAPQEVVDAFNGAMNQMPTTDSPF